MSEESLTSNDQPVTAKKSRLVLMGEFSAGKSTLSNILLDSAPLPMRVTATRLPPVQISYGAPAAFAVAVDGTRGELSLDGIEDVSLHDTRMIEIKMESDVLQLCDILDMPGISDPNMPKETWEDVIEPRDHVIWCTHATQAWRQSEAAIWNIMRAQTSCQNLLLITQFDKLRNERDKDRVVRRVTKETEGLFDAIYPVSLLSALEAGGDYSVWEGSGAAALSEHVIKILMQTEREFLRVPTEQDDILQNDLRDTAALREFAASAPPAASPPERVIPRRVLRDTGGMRRQRPDFPDQSALRG